MIEGKKITAEMVKELRIRSGVGIMDCKEALKECGGDIDESFDYLRSKGLATAFKRSGKVTSEGVVQSYVHLGGKIGVLVEINCETDFVSRTTEFNEFSKNVAMHIAAFNPLGISSEDIPLDIINKEKKVYKDQAFGMGESEEVSNKIVVEKLNKFINESCLLKQQYVKEKGKTVSDYLNEMIARTGELISINRFVRFEMGEN